MVHSEHVSTKMHDSVLTRACRGGRRPLHFVKVVIFFSLFLTIQDLPRFKTRLTLTSNQAHKPISTF